MAKKKSAGNQLPAVPPPKSKRELRKAAVSASLDRLRGFYAARKATESADPDARQRRLLSVANAHLAEAAKHKASAKSASSAQYAAKFEGFHERAAGRAADIRKQLPPGYAMVFGKLRKITGAKPKKKLSK